MYLFGFCKRRSREESPILMKTNGADKDIEKGDGVPSGYHDIYQTSSKKISSHKDSFLNLCDRKDSGYFGEEITVSRVIIEDNVPAMEHFEMCELNQKSSLKAENVNNIQLNYSGGFIEMA